MRAKISWITRAKQQEIAPGVVYRPTTTLNGQSFQLVVIILPDKKNVKVEAFSEYGKKIIETSNFEKLILMEGAQVVGELEIYKEE